MDNELKNKILQTGTTILGIVCKDGIVMASDRQVTAGGQIVMSKNEQKTVQINDYLVASWTGGASDAQMLNKIIAAELRLKELKSRQRPTVKEAANLIGMMTFRNIRQPAMIPSIVGTLVAGFNENGTAELYSLDPSGTLSKIEDFDANFGSGMPYVLGLLERQYKKGMTVKEGIDLAIEAIKSSTQRDVGSGFGIDVFTISSEGIKHVFKQKIKPSFEND